MRRSLPAVAALVAVLALAGCNTETALNSAGPQPSATPPPSAGANPTAESGGGRTDTKAALPAVDLSAERLQFAPIVGATVESVAPLAKELSARAGQRGLKLVPANDPSTTLLLKGYFSALSDSDKTTVIYVWDVLDPAGNRLHRIEGQEKAPAGKGHGFAAVTDDTMRAIADQTIDQLISWLAARKA